MVVLVILVLVLYLTFLSAFRSSKARSITT